MITLGTLYIVCGIIYTIACVMDGQDVKPLWKKWVGKKLEKAANFFFPIKYVTETKFIPVPSPTPFERCDYNIQTFDAVKVQSQAMITEEDLLLDSRYMPYREKDAKAMLINQQQSKCINAIFREIAAENLVNFEIDKESAWPNVIVRAWMYVGKKRR